LPLFGLFWITTLSYVFLHFEKLTIVNFIRHFYCYAQPNFNPEQSYSHPP